jgi:hypothetical protein
MATPFTKTVDGYESQFQVSFVELEIPAASCILLTYIKFIDQLPFTLGLDLSSTADDG